MGFYKLAEKAGFRLEGRAKEYLKINVVWQDHLMFTKISERARSHRSWSMLCSLHEGSNHGSQIRPPTPTPDARVP